MYPTLFVSHGAPNIILGESITKTNLKKLAKTINKPKYIIIFSAHYTSQKLEMINYEAKELMYDFYGFEKELYEFKFPIKSDKEISLNILNHLKSNNIDITINQNRTTYDHGVWSVLSMMYDTLDIPVIQLSVPLQFSSEELIKLGQTLQLFKDEAMIITSGGVTHNLSDISHSKTIKQYAKEFNDIILDSILNGDKDRLIEVIGKELFYKNHPTNEHFLPLLIAFGSATNKNGISFNSEMLYSNISMESFVFDMLI
jgi:4,5-DOPA dioxygenase extradiol